MMKNSLSNPEKKILKAFSFDLEVTIEGKKRISSLAQRLIAAVYSEADSENIFEYKELGSDELRLRLCRSIKGTKQKEPLKPAIKEALDHGLLYPRSPYSNGKSCFGYAISNKFMAGLKIWTKNPKQADLKNYAPSIPDFKWRGASWDITWLNDLSLDPLVIELLDVNKDNHKRLNRLAYDVRRIIKRKHYISEGNTWRITMLTNQICSDLRQYLTFKGKRLVEGDIKTCHPTLLAWIYKNWDSDDAQLERQSFVEYIQNPKNDFYSMFMDIATPRDQAKTNFNSWLNGSENQVTHGALHKKFPLLADRIKSINDKERKRRKQREEEFRIENKLSREKAHKRYKEPGMKRVVGCVIQMLEAKIVCGKCFKYALENGKLFLPIHDGFQCLPEDYELFSKMIIEGFQEKADVTVRVDMTPESKGFLQSMKAV